jgi:2-hydroxychromene-2-carboxylate isomerase
VVQPVFYYDLGSPECYLAAECVLAELPVVPEWEPVLAAELAVPPFNGDRGIVERVAAERELQPTRWPLRWPPEVHTATLAATYAKQIGRAVAFTLACFRQEFAAGRDLGDLETVLIAAAACEMHPSAVLRAIELRSVEQALTDACDRAIEAAVSRLPAIQVGPALFEGEEAVERAAEALGVPA